MAETPTKALSPEFLMQLAARTDLPLSLERAEHLARVLSPALTKLRALRPDEYERLAPAIAFRVP